MQKLILVAALAITASSKRAGYSRARDRCNRAEGRSSPNYSDYRPAVGLRRNADFLVQEVTIRGDSTLSIIDPDGYRPQIAEGMGGGYAVEITGLNMPVQWSRSGPGEVFLNIPYELTIVPRS